MKATCFRNICIIANGPGIDTIQGSPIVEDLVEDLGTGNSGFSNFIKPDKEVPFWYWKCSIVVKSM